MLNFSISMSVGEVMFGNIGVPTRLTFSAIGTAEWNISEDELPAEAPRSSPGIGCCPSRGFSVTDINQPGLFCTRHPVKSVSR